MMSFAAAISDLHFPAVLQATGLDAGLKAASDPNYQPPELPAPTYQFELPWWFAGSQLGAAP
jgi:hypothetical protein